MAKRRDPHIAGVVPAIYTPFNSDLTIDERSLQRLADRMAATDGVGAVFCIGHAGEVASLTVPERKRVVRCVAEAIAGRVPILAGVYCDSLEESIEHARDAKEAGAAAVTVFPPNVFFGGATADSERPFRWIEAIAKRAEIPICVFQFPPGSGIGYSTDTLVRLASLPEVVAVKEGSGSPRIYEDNVAALGAVDPPVSVLSSNNEWWLADLAFGGDGILSGSGPVLAKEQVALWRAVKAGDLGAARRIQVRIRPLLRIFYKSPDLDMHNRMKNALVMMDVIPCAAVRPPLLPLGSPELADIRAGLKAAGPI
jgi:4-hydroxy-tetrahydrodipicolinate synthase